MTISKPTPPVAGPSIPGLADVRARRVEIAKLISALKTEDRELAKAETVLLRLAGMAEVIPSPSSAPASMAASTPGLAAIAEPPHPNVTTTLVPATVLPPAPAPAAKVSPASTPGQDGTEDEDDDDGFSLVEAVKNAMIGNENLEALIVLLMDKCSDTWWTPDEIQHYISEIKGENVPMRSITLILDVMKKKGLLVRDGLNAGLPPKVSKSD